MGKTFKKSSPKPWGTQLLAPHIEEEVYLSRHKFVKARVHPPQTFKTYRTCFATRHKAPEQIHKLLFRDTFSQRTVIPFHLSRSICICMYIVWPFYSIIEPCSICFHFTVTAHRFIPKWFFNSILCICQKQWNITYNISHYARKCMHILLLG